MPGEPSIILILGVHRSGTSCMAGILSHLGVPMGRSGLRPNGGNPKGFYEDRLLRQLSRRCGRVEFPRQRFTVPFPQRVALLRQWCRQRSRQSVDEPIIGGKLPALGMMVRELDTALKGRWKAIVTERSIKESARSRHKWRWRLQSVASIESDLLELAAKRDADLQRFAVPVLRVSFANLLGEPVATVAAVIAFCGLSPSPQQLQAAIASVDPKLNHETPT